MNKTFFCSVLAVATLLLTVQSINVEARGYCHHPRSSVRVSVGAFAPARPVYIASPYAPVPPPVVYAAPVYAAPVYVNPYPVVYAAPVPAPMYVEEVYMAPRPRPAPFSGLSFSWNFFR